LYYVSERLHLEQQGAVKMKCWRRSKAQKKTLEPKRTPNKKLSSNVLLESLSMLDLPTSSTSDSMPSSSTSPVLSDMRVTQEINSIEHSKQTIKTPRVTKNRKVPVQTMQMTDNAVELNIESPTLIDQNSIVSSQIFSSHISTVTASNSSIVTSSSIPNQSFSSNITSQSIINSNSQSIANSFTCQSIASNISSQSIAGNILSQSKAGNSLKVVSSQTVSNNGQMINISQTMNSNNQAFINNNTMVVNNISSNVCNVYFYLSFCFVLNRFSPFFVEPMIVALDEETLEPYMCDMDLIGCVNKSDNFVVGGTSSSQLYGLCEALWEPDMEEDQLFETISQALVSACNRDAISGWGAKVYIM